MKIGILGGGQLGRMLALEAHRLNLSPLVLDPKPDCAAAAVAKTLAADWGDPTALAELAGCDVVTYEFENVPATVASWLAERVAVRPGPEALRQTGDRLLEKQLLRSLGIPTARFRSVGSEAELRAAVAELGLPAVLKTRRLGYDGRGQRVLRTPQDLAGAWRQLGGSPLILEEFVDFDREASLLAVRAADGAVRFWAATENRHVDGILRISRAPAPEVAPASLERAKRWMKGLLVHLDYVGVAAVEFFVQGDEWIANEVACRVHNSGHWTLDGAATSQFENHLRAVAGLPLGSTRRTEPSVMVNLIGTRPAPGAVLETPGARLHDYGKSPAPGRKLGHVNLTAPTAVEAEHKLALLARRLRDPALERALHSPWLSPWEAEPERQAGRPAAAAEPARA